MSKKKSKKIPERKTPHGGIKNHGKLKKANGCHIEQKQIVKKTSFRQKKAS